MDERLRQYRSLWLILLALLALNVGLSFVPLGKLNGALPVLIAGVQGFLIVSYFMYMRHAAPVPRIAAAAGFVWLMIMAGLALSDYRTRPADFALGRLLPLVDWAPPARVADPTPLKSAPVEPQ